MNIIERLGRWHQTRKGLAVTALLELALAYYSLSVAIDSGDWWRYLLALIFIIGFLTNTGRLISAWFAKTK